MTAFTPPFADEIQCHGKERDFVPSWETPLILTIYDHAEGLFETAG